MQSMHADFFASEPILNNSLYGRLITVGTLHQSLRYKVWKKYLPLRFMYTLYVLIMYETKTQTFTYK